jgi:hypothetical protein
MRAVRALLLQILIFSSLVACTDIVEITLPSAHAQALPGGCPGRWINYGGGMACQCPDGSLASGYPTISCGGGGGYRQPSGIHCGAGRYCPQGTSCCGTRCCNSGWQCSLAGCIPIGAQACSTQQYCTAGSKCSQGGGCVPEDADDCGRGRSCPAGRVCWTPSDDIAGFTKGETSCTTRETRAELEKQLELQRKERKEAADKAALEKKEAELRSKIKKDMASHQKEDASAREELEKALVGNGQQRLQTEFAGTGTQAPNTSLQKLEAMARGEPPSVEGSVAPPSPIVVQGETAKRLQPTTPFAEKRTIGPSPDTFKRPPVTGFDGPPVSDPELRQRMEQQAEAARRAEADRLAAQKAADEASAKAREHQLSEERKQREEAAAERAKEAAQVFSGQKYTQCRNLYPGETPCPKTMALEKCRKCTVRRFWFDDCTEYTCP